MEAVVQTAMVQEAPPTMLVPMAAMGEDLGAEGPLIKVSKVSTEYINMQLG